MSVPILRNVEQPKSMVSIFSPHRKMPKKYMAGSHPNSVFYVLPKNHIIGQYTFLKALYSFFTGNLRLGLVSKENSENYIYEAVLSTKKCCKYALKKYLGVRCSEGIIHLFPAIEATPPDRDLYKVKLSQLPILRPGVLRKIISKNLSEYGTILDIVLYRDDLSASWFTGNGYVYMLCSKQLRQLNTAPQCINLSHPSGLRTVLKWNKQ